MSMSLAFPTDEASLVDRIIPIAPSPDLPHPPGPYEHQSDALNVLDGRSMMATPPVSGIVFLPTGSGKTRIGIQHMARVLNQDPGHRFIWATSSRNLICQTFQKLHEYGRLFSNPTNALWLNQDLDDEDFDNAHILFMTRKRLTAELDVATNLRYGSHPLRDRILESRPTTLIYDECHQLGADTLQGFWGQLHEKVLDQLPPRRHRWRVIGLSATPMPTRVDAHPLLQEHVFPPRTDVPGVPNDWNIHILHKTTLQELLDRGILCRVNSTLDRSGCFDLPTPLIKGVVIEKRIPQPPRTRDKAAWSQYCATFNSKVMTHPRVLRFFADKLARHLDTLGKTIVFVPTIEAANHLVELLGLHPSLKGRVAGVHSKVDDLSTLLPDQANLSVPEILAGFRERREQPCILVNVDMLTEGFDDPKVQTVFIARLTLSTNRFWQMIGRGTRGPAAGGTLTCNVLDPIKLSRLYDYTAGYQPAIANPNAVELEESAIKEADRDADDLRSPAIIDSADAYPLPSDTCYSIDPIVQERLGSVARTLADFLNHSILPTPQLLEAAQAVQVAFDDQGPRFIPADRPEPATSHLILHEIVTRIARMLEADMNWLHRRIPASPTPADAANWLQQLDRVRSIPIRTEVEFDRPAAEVPLTPAPSNHQERALALLTTCQHLARIDGQIDPSEVEASLRAATENTGIPDGPLLRDAFHNAERRDLAGALEQLKSPSDVPTSKRLLKSWIVVARADQRIHPAEHGLLVRWTEHLGLTRDYLEGLLDA
jgi:superfamily II DNA or RNA helicase/uncharacterized tellurite resistance protein B-like protein